MRPLSSPAVVARRVLVVLVLAGAGCGDVGTPAAPDAALPADAAGDAAPAPLAVPVRVRLLTSTDARLDASLVAADVAPLLAGAQQIWDPAGIVFPLESIDVAAVAPAAADAFAAAVATGTWRRSRRRWRPRCPARRCSIRG